MTKAHTQSQTITLVEAFPEHEPRESDPHYHLFNEARTRLTKLGALTCWIQNADCAGGPIELHHSQIEFALANIVDVEHFSRLYPDFNVKDDDSFLCWIESEGNLLPLCAMHHRGILGIHTIHYPAWLVQRVMKAGVAPPERKVNVGPHNPGHHRPPPAQLPRKA